MNEIREYLKKQEIGFDEDMTDEQLKSWISLNQIPVPGSGADEVPAAVSEKMELLEEDNQKLTKAVEDKDAEIETLKADVEAAKANTDGDEATKEVQAKLDEANEKITDLEAQLEAAKTADPEKAGAEPTPDTPAGGKKGGKK